MLSDTVVWNCCSHLGINEQQLRGMLLFNIFSIDRVGAGDVARREVIRFANENELGRPWRE